MSDKQPDWRQLADQQAAKPEVDVVSSFSGPLSKSEWLKLVKEIHRPSLTARILPPLVSAILVAACFFTYLVFSQDSRAEIPEVQQTPSRIVEQSMRDWMVELESIFAEAAGLAQQERWKNDREFGAEFEVLLTESRQRHFRPINRLIQDNLAGENWSGERASALFSEFSKGFRGVAR